MKTLHYFLDTDQNFQAHVNLSNGDWMFCGQSDQMYWCDPEQTSLIEISRQAFDHLANKGEVCLKCLESLREWEKP